MTDTIAAIATGTTISAIGIIRLSGDKAITAAETFFTPASGKPVTEHPEKTLIYGDLKHKDGTLLDKCLCTIARAPNTYTGEDTAELHCHGSPTVLRLALEALFSTGVRQAKAGEFTQRAFLNHRMDLTQAEAVVDLIEAETQEAAQNAAGQLGGAIQRKIDAIYSNLVDIISHYHAVLDYPDEDIASFEIEHYTGIFKQARGELKRLMDTFERGKILKTGVRTVILGKPNVGKSTLLNALLGYDRAIVTPIPGTTRDTIEEAVIVGGVKLRLIDTAGVRESADPIEQQGIDRAKKAAETADLALVLFDSTQPLTEEDIEAAKAASSSKYTIFIETKIDIQKSTVFDRKNTVFEKNTSVFNDFDRKLIEKISLSALTGEGVNMLQNAVSRLFRAENPPIQGEIITNSRQFDAITRAHDFLAAAEQTIGQGSTPDIVLTETENALKALGELSGRTVRDDITHRIFERFCVGK